MAEGGGRPLPPRALSEFVDYQALQSGNIERLRSRWKAQLVAVEEELRQAQAVDEAKSTSAVQTLATMERGVEELRDAVRCVCEVRSASAAPLITPAVRAAATAKANLGKVVRTAETWLSIEGTVGELQQLLRDEPLALKLVYLECAALERWREALVGMLQHYSDKVRAAERSRVRTPEPVSPASFSPPSVPTPPDAVRRVLRWSPIVEADATATPPLAPPSDEPRSPTGTAGLDILDPTISSPHTYARVVAALASHMGCVLELGCHVRQTLWGHVRDSFELATSNPALLVMTFEVIELHEMAKMRDAQAHAPESEISVGPEGHEAADRVHGHASAESSMRDSVGLMSECEQVGPGAQALSPSPPGSPTSPSTVRKARATRTRTRTRTKRKESAVAMSGDGSGEDGGGAGSDGGAEEGEGDFRHQALTILHDTINDRAVHAFARFHMRAAEEGQCGVSAALSAASGVLSELEMVQRHLCPCLPPHYSTLALARNLYQSRLLPQVEALYADPSALDVSDILRIITWLHFFNRKVVQLGAGAPALQFR